MFQNTPFYFLHHNIYDLKNVSTLQWVEYNCGIYTIQEFRFEAILRILNCFQNPIFYSLIIQRF